MFRLGLGTLAPPAATLALLRGHVALDAVAALLGRGGRSGGGGLQSRGDELRALAGLVRGASKGEGLGNQFLANIRESAAILHVVRCFDDDNITHVDGGVDPLRDVDTIETELLLADLQSVEKRLDKLQKLGKFDKNAKAAAAQD